MALFSERYGYTKGHLSIIKESMPESVINILCTLFDTLKEDARLNHQPCFDYAKLELDVWCFYLKKRKNDIYNAYGNQKDVITSYLEDSRVSWDMKLSLLEYVLAYLNSITESNHYKYDKLFASIVDYINGGFESCYYGYRVVNLLITPITEEQEIESIEKALSENKDNVKEHLKRAVEHFSNRESPDYRNSIKESITAVEVICRELTGENTLGKALKKLEKNGVKIHPQLREAYSKLYDYSNQDETGIRHALMDIVEEYTPTYNEAYYMLVSCSAFINYLRGISTKIKEQ